MYCEFPKNLGVCVHRDHITFGIQNDDQIKTIQRTRDLTLEKCVDICQNTGLVAERLSRWQEHSSSSLTLNHEGQVRATPP